MKREAQMFITLDELDILVERLRAELHVAASSDSRSVYITKTPLGEPD